MLEHQSNHAQANCIYGWFYLLQSELLAVKCQSDTQAGSVNSNSLVSSPCTRCFATGSTLLSLLFSSAISPAALPSAMCTWLLSASELSIRIATFYWYFILNYLNFLWLCSSPVRSTPMSLSLCSRMIFCCFWPPWLSHLPLGNSCSPIQSWSRLICLVKILLCCLLKHLLWHFLMLFCSSIFATFIHRQEFIQTPLSINIRCFRCESVASRYTHKKTYACFIP